MKVEVEGARFLMERLESLDRETRARLDAEIVGHITRELENGSRQSLVRIAFEVPREVGEAYERAAWFNRLRIAVAHQVIREVLAREELR